VNFSPPSITRILGLACTAALLSSTTAGAAAPTPAPAPAGLQIYHETPAWADTFVDSVGVDSTFADHNYPPIVKTELEWSGIRHLRDSSNPYPTMVALYADLGAHGIKHSIGENAGFTAADLKSRLDAFAPYVDYVEPGNEMDNVSNPNYAQMRADQQNIWTVVHSSSAYQNVAVYGPGFANPLNAVHLEPIDPIEDFAQMHNSTCDWNPGSNNFGSGILANEAKTRLSTHVKPIVTTETGFQDNPIRGCSMPDNLIARYIPRSSVDHFLVGEQRTYFDFLTDTTNVAFGGLGLLKIDGTPKPQFFAESNLLHLLSDKGVAPSAVPTSFGITGETPDIEHLTLARRDGSLDLLVWREVPCWDHKLRVVIPVAPVPVTVTLPANKSFVGLFSPTPTYGFTRTVLPVNARTGVTATFNVTDSITVLHIYGHGGGR
jgi:hypothetical protein